MSLHTLLGSSGNILDEKVSSEKAIRLETPLLTNDQFDQLENDGGFLVTNIFIGFNADQSDKDLDKILDSIVSKAAASVLSGTNLLVLSDFQVESNYIPIPSLLVVSAVHQCLLSKGLRSKCSIIVSAGDVWETHHFACLLGFGADAIHPYLTWQILESNQDKESANQRIANYCKGVSGGLLKIISKIGISTIESYKGAQIFEIVGLHENIVDTCFKGTVSRLSGIDFSELKQELLSNYQYLQNASKDELLDQGGLYQWKKDQEQHSFNPETIHLLQYATRKKDYSIFKKYCDKINDLTKANKSLRSLLGFKKRSSISIDEVESVADIVKRFATGAMSFGSISYEAHTALAAAMNQLGAKSNSGEGGEDPIRYSANEKGEDLQSKIKQIASGRFGVTTEYLCNAIELQIKMAQGAKPGEGGQLPGHKVDPWIAKVRHSTPGVGLISPPPHHDIYSIEDLSQLIYDLKNVNETARINVKLVSKTGVGVIASGVAKAKAEAILISGHDGGTGASPLSSIMHAGLPWEMGLAEAHQSLVKNGLRDRVVLQTDGQIRTGRDIAVACILGAEEWGVATAALIVQGCIMMRKCHLNTCPVGIATQDKALRKNYNGEVEHIITFFEFLAQNLREIMAELGISSINKLVGRTDLLEMSEVKLSKTAKLNLDPLLYQFNHEQLATFYHSKAQDHEIENILDRQLIELAKKAVGQEVEEIIKLPIRNTDRAVGAMLSGWWQEQKEFSPEHKLNFEFKGSAGQSFAAFLNERLSFTLIGEANDYVGKGFSGGSLIIKAPSDAAYEASKQIIIGNVAFYGATGGTAFIAGVAGERFAVRNSGANLVVEGTGDHACEYMTGGRVMMLGSVGKNFGAGMSGGIAYIFDPENHSDKKINTETVLIKSPSAFYLKEIQHLLECHWLNTGSQQAKLILDNWSSAKNEFKMIMPIEYQKALQKKKSSSLDLVTTKNTINGQSQRVS
ncbi:UNVERIFIED_CONTAM: hypothetical protein GTU68_054899 [Idotea baltica]|nr:hypothetical protein [Idotea baltica]